MNLSDLQPWLLLVLLVHPLGVGSEMARDKANRPQPPKESETLPEGIRDREGESVSPQPTSSEPKEPPDFWAEVKRYVFGRFGWVGLVALLILIWLGSQIELKDLARVPPIRTVISWWKSEPLPQASPDRFTVAVAMLDGDTDGRNRTLITQSLAELKGVDIMMFDRKIEVGLGNVRDEIQKGHRTAKELLSESDANVLLWGMVLQHDGVSVPKLFWTTSEPSLEIPPDRYVIGANLELPEIFWEDLSTILGLLVEAEAVRLSPQSETLDLREVSHYVNRVRVLLGAEDRRRWNEEARIRVRLILAAALVALGQHTGESAQFREAQELYRHVLGARTKESDTLQWAQTVLSLGKALVLEGESNRGRDKLEDATALFREAVAVYELKANADDLARAKLFLANALSQVGVRDLSNEALKEAISLYQDVERVWSREARPQTWVGLQLSHCTALRQLAQKEASNDESRTGERSGRKNVDEAIRRYGLAIEIVDRERAPVTWGSLQNNLAVALLELQDLHDRDVKHLEDAIEACRQALTVRTIEASPYLWAQTTVLLGQALSSKGEATKQSSDLRQALLLFDRAEAVITKERFGLHWAEIQLNRANTLSRLGVLERDPNILCEALGYHIIAWDEMASELPALAPTLSRGVVLTALLLQFDFEKSVSQPCIDRHAEGLKRVPVPRELAPAFSVEPGKSEPGPR